VIVILIWRSSASTREPRSPPGWHRRLLGRAPGQPAVCGRISGHPERASAEVRPATGSDESAVTITVPVRVTQAADDERVYANPAPLPGTDTLIREINAANIATGNTVTYQRYPAGTVPPDPVLGIHFATINYDTPALLNWLEPLFMQPPVA